VITSPKKFGNAITIALTGTARVKKATTYVPNSVPS
jgi:hypothetical protein